MAGFRPSFAWSSSSVVEVPDRDVREVVERVGPQVSPPGFDHWAIFPRGYYDSKWNVDGTTQQIGTYSTTYIRTQTLDFFDEAERDDDQP